MLSLLYTKTIFLFVNNFVNFSLRGQYSPYVLRHLIRNSIRMKNFRSPHCRSWTFIRSHFQFNVWWTKPNHYNCFFLRNLRILDYEEYKLSNLNQKLMISTLDQPFSFLTSFRRCFLFRQKGFIVSTQRKLVGVL